MMHTAEYIDFFHILVFKIKEMTRPFIIYKNKKITKIKWLKFTFILLYMI